MIVIENLTHSIQETIFFKNLFFKFDVGCNYLICGSNASGKSLLCSIMGGILTPDEGDIKVSQTSLYQTSDLELLKIRKKIGIMFQRPALISNLSIYENLLLAMNFYYPQLGQLEKKEEILHHLKNIELVKYRDFRPDLLSSGQQNLLAFLRMIIGNPEIILCDGNILSIDNNFHPWIISNLNKLQASNKTLIFFSSSTQLLPNYKFDKILQINNLKLVQT